MKQLEWNTFQWTMVESYLLQSKNAGKKVSNAQHRHAHTGVQKAFGQLVLVLEQEAETI